MIRPRSTITGDTVNYTIISRRNGWITVAWSDGRITHHSIG